MLPPSARSLERPFVAFEVAADVEAFVHVNSCGRNGHVVAQTTVDLAACIGRKLCVIEMRNT